MKKYNSDSIKPVTTAEMSEMVKTLEHLFPSKPQPQPQLPQAVIGDFNGLPVIRDAIYKEYGYVRIPWNWIESLEAKKSVNESKKESEPEMPEGTEVAHGNKFISDIATFDDNDMDKISAENVLTLHDSKGASYVFAFNITTEKIKNVLRALKPDVQEEVLKSVFGDFYVAPIENEKCPYRKGRTE